MGDSPAGVVCRNAVVGTVATARSGVGDYAIIGGLGTLTSDFNYGFQFVNGNLHIDPATVAASLTGTVQKVYDGTTAATLSATNYQLTGVLSGDSVALTGPANGVYDSKDVGTSKIVSVTGLTLLGPDAGNYVLTAPNLSGAVGVIDPAAVTASLTGTVHKVYDGTDCGHAFGGELPAGGHSVRRQRDADSAAKAFMTVRTWARPKPLA